MRIDSSVDSQDRIAIEEVVVVPMLRCRIDQMRWVRAVAVVLALGLYGARSAAALPANAGWGEVIEAYLRDPAANVNLLIDRVGDRSQSVPIVVRLALADAFLRRGDLVAARRLLAPLADAAPLSPWSGFAQLGLGMVEAQRGNVSEARTRFALASGAPGTVGRAALLAAAHAAAANGDGAAAQSSLDRLLLGPKGVPPGIRWAAEFARASMMLAGHQPREAARAFSALRRKASNGAQATDASYGEAHAALRQGDVEGARLALRALLDGCSTKSSGDAERTHHLSIPLLRLESRAILRAWLQNYRTTSFAGADSGAVYALHGCDLAADQLVALDSQAPASHARLAGRAGRLPTEVVPLAPVQPTKGGQSVSTSSDDEVAPGAPLAHPLPWSSIAALGIALVFAALAWRERGSS